MVVVICFEEIQHCPSPRIFGEDLPFAKDLLL